VAAPESSLIWPQGGYAPTESVWHLANRAHVALKVIAKPAAGEKLKGAERPAVVYQLRVSASLSF
jgi:hypothetical protein